MTGKEKEMAQLTACLDTSDFWLDGEMLFLAKRPTQILSCLVRHRGFTTSLDALGAIWDEEPEETGYRGTQVEISRLRRVLGRDSIRSRIGVGYVLTIPVEIVGRNGNGASGGKP